jgi:hypothetical protein
MANRLFCSLDAALIGEHWISGDGDHLQAWRDLGSAV